MFIIQPFFTRRGVWDTLAILGCEENATLLYEDFIENIKEHANYASFQYARESLMKQELIEIYLSSQNYKTIKLTEKGRKVYSKLVDIQTIMEAD